MRTVAILLVLAGSAMAGEYAVLATGARLRADRHELDGTKITLYTKTGSTQLDATQIVRFEPEEFVPTPSETAQPAPSPGVKLSDPKSLIDNAARKYGLPAALVRAVAAAESGYRADAVSPKGAIGLMQLMPDTARELGADPKNPEQNVDAGARYLRDLLLKYDGRMFHALAAYNAGPGAVEKYHGIPPYRETHSYIWNVWRKSQKEQESN